MSPNDAEYLKGYELALDLVMVCEGACDCDLSAWLRWSPFRAGDHAHHGWGDAVTGRPRQVRRAVH